MDNNIIKNICDKIHKDFLKCTNKYIPRSSIRKCRKINHFHYLKCSDYYINLPDYEYYSYTDLN